MHSSDASCSTIEKMIGFVFTNFNNSKFTLQAVQSISESPEAHRCFVVVVDNCSDRNEVKILSGVRSLHPNIHIIEGSQNVGYFRGLNIGIEYLKCRFPKLNTIVVGNNDLIFSRDFVSSLDRNKDLFNEYPVVSPDIVTLDGVHQNPLVISGISRSREVIWDVYYSSYVFAIPIRKIASAFRRFLERRDYQSHTISQPIYQGYGACYILTVSFFNNFGLLWAPTFLMREEFFLAKQIESKGYRVYYEADISVQHHDHAAISKLPTKRIWEITRKSHKLYRKFFTPYRVQMDTGYRYQDYLSDNKDTSDE